MSPKVDRLNLMSMEKDQADESKNLVVVVGGGGQKGSICFNST